MAVKKKDAVSEYLSRIGSKGGKTKGKSKVRGDSSYYSQISKRKAVKK